MPAGVSVETCVMPGENPFCPFGAEELSLDQKPRDLARKNLGQPRAVNPGDVMEEAASSTPPPVTRKWRCGPESEKITFLPER